MTPAFYGFSRDVPPPPPPPLQLSTKEYPMIIACYKFIPFPSLYFLMKKGKEIPLSEALCWAKFLSCTFDQGGSQDSACLGVLVGAK